MQTKENASHLITSATTADTGLYELPDEILMMIFSYLSTTEKLQLRKVSKRSKALTELSLDFPRLLQTSLSNRLEQTHSLEQLREIIPNLKTVENYFDSNQLLIEASNVTKERVAKEYYQKHKYDWKKLANLFLLPVSFFGYLVLTYLFFTVYREGKFQNSTDFKRCFDSNTGKSDIQSCQDSLDIFENIALADWLMLGIVTGFLGKQVDKFLNSLFIKHCLAKTILPTLNPTPSAGISSNMNGSETENNKAFYAWKAYKSRDKILLAIGVLLAIGFGVLKPFSFNVEDCAEKTIDKNGEDILQLNPGCLDRNISNITSNILGFGIVEGSILSFTLFTLIALACKPVEKCYQWGTGGRKLQFFPWDKTPSEIELTPVEQPTP